jgi:alkylation response protein AidB-like acyl-CoA dehydrogenase
MTTILSTLAEPDGAPRQRQLDWLERARAVAPAIAEWRDAAEQERHLPSALFEILRRTGLFALGAPPELGGASIGHEDLLEVVEELSRHDGSVGWNVTVAAHAAVVAGTYLPEASRGEIDTRVPTRSLLAVCCPRGPRGLSPVDFSSADAGGLRAVASRLTGCWHQA